MATSTTLAVTLIAGITVGAGGSALLSTTTTLTPRYDAHALDLRKVRGALDGGDIITAEVWGDRQRPDGGWRDLGAGRPCPLTTSADELCKVRLMRSAASCLRDE